jgi:hypothetical protein
VTEVTEIIAVRKYSMQWGVPRSPTPHERTNLKHHHYGLILALVCIWLALVVASAVVFVAFA